MVSTTEYQTGWNLSTNLCPTKSISAFPMVDIFEIAQHILKDKNHSEISKMF